MNLSAPHHMIRRTQVVATESRNNVLSYKNEEDGQINRQGDVMGQGKRGDMGGGGGGGGL